MNKVFYFVLGAGAGFFCGVIASSIYEKKKDTLIDVKEDEFFEKDEVEAEELVNPTEEDLVDREYGILSPEQRQEIREKLHKNYIGTTNYATKFGSLTDKEFDELEIESLYPREEDDEEEIIDDMMNRPIESEKSPEIVSYSLASELPNYYENSSLFLYLKDGVIVDEDDNELLDPLSIVGEINPIINEYENSGEPIIFVRNYVLNTIYEIQIIDKAWNEVLRE